MRERDSVIEGIMSEKKFDKKSKDHEIAKPFAELSMVFFAAIILIPLLGVFSSWILSLGTSSAFSGVLFWFKMTTTILAMFGIAVAIYSFIRLHEIEKEEERKLGLTLTWEHERTEKNHRWERVEEQLRSSNPSDWKVAILDADNILDEIVERMGYHGTTLGERMKMIEPSDFPYLDDAWKAHKTRNDIAHQGGDEFTLTRSTAEQTINIYHRIFKELGYL